jgi:nitrogen PTS system EIIA component
MTFFDRATDNMSLKDLLNPDAILPSLKVTSKKAALQEISEKAAQVSGIPAREIFDALLQRERLGSTGVGNGIAIPHGKLVKAGRIFGVFARLDRPLRSCFSFDCARNSGR